MHKKNTQEEIWSGEFGRAYTNRNPQSVDEMNALYQKQFGFTRSALNKEFLNSLDRSIRILEVGVNIGIQLQALQLMGFTNLYGIELQSYAVEKAKSLTKNINLIQGSAFDIPFKDDYFDLVYTSGVLIHISPENLEKVMSEMYRCSASRIWGFEYFAETLTEVSYRGHNDLLWKSDYAAHFQKQFPDLELVQKRMVQYIENTNVDQMYMLKKVGPA